MRSPDLLSEAEVRAYLLHLRRDERLPCPSLPAARLWVMFVASVGHELRLPRQSLLDEAIYRQWPRATQDKGSETGEVQEVSFITRLPKLCAGCSYAQELDRAEPVGQMHSKHRHEQNH